MIKQLLIAATLLLATPTLAGPYITASIYENLSDTSVSNLRRDAYSVGAGYEFNKNISAEISMTSLNGLGTSTVATLAYSPVTLKYAKPYVFGGLGISDIALAKDATGGVTVLGFGADLPVYKAVNWNISLQNTHGINVDTNNNRRLDLTTVSTGIKYKF